MPRRRPSEIVVRQKSDSTRTQIVSFRLTNEEYEFLRVLAEQNGMSPHELVRRLTRAYLKSKGLNTVLARAGER